MEYLNRLRSKLSDADRRQIASISTASNKYLPEILTWVQERMQRYRAFHHTARAAARVQAMADWKTAVLDTCSGPYADLGLKGEFAATSPDPAYPVLFAPLKTRFAEVVRTEFKKFADGSHGFVLCAQIQVSDQLVCDFIAFPDPLFRPLAPSEHPVEFCEEHADPGQPLSISAEVFAIRREKLSKYLIRRPSEGQDSDYVGKLSTTFGGDLYTGVAGTPSAPVMTQFNLCLPAAYTTPPDLHTIRVLNVSGYPDLRVNPQYTLYAIRNGAAHKALAEAMATCFDIPRDVAMGLSSPAEIPAEMLRVNHVPRYFRFLDAIDAIPTVVLAE